jgi:hypothetical protein
MEFKEIINLFKKAIERNEWGNQSYILIMDDCSGEVVSEEDEYDGELAFEFNSEEELIRKLKK